MFVKNHMKNVLKIIWNITKKVLPIGLVILVMWFFFIRPKNDSVLVKEIKVENKVVEKTVSASGTVESLNQANLSFQTLGKIQRINVKEGDTVKEGNLIAYLDAKSQAENVQYYKDARDIIVRNIELFTKDKQESEDSVGGETEYNITLRRYNEQLSQAEAAYQGQIAALSNSYIYSPVDGTVVDITKEEGETASISETIVKVADLENLVFKIKVDQEDYGYIKMDQPVEIELDSYPDVKFSGKVSKLPFFAQSGTDDFEIEIRIDTKEEYPIRLNMTGDAHIILAKTDTEVPTLSLGDYYFDEEDKPYVWVIVNNKIQKRNIEVGLEGDLYTELKTQINEPIVVPQKDNLVIKEGYTAILNGNKK